LLEGEDHVATLGHEQLLLEVLHRVALGLLHYQREVHFGRHSFVDLVLESDGGLRTRSELDLRQRVYGARRLELTPHIGEFVGSQLEEYMGEVEGGLGVGLESLV
jgi:hypothetical protein